MSQSKMTEIASKTLGDSTSYAVYTDQYDPTLLNPMPRHLAREENNISGDEFSGYDVWHCYESTFLTNNSHPVSGILKIVYPSNTLNMVESKSMKLFLNSFDMCKLGDNIREASSNYVSIVRKSLIDCLGDSRVEVNFFRHVDIFNGDIELIQNPLIENAKMFDASESEFELTDDVSYVYDDSKKSYLHHIHSSTLPKKFVHAFESLRSRCRHTKQKDTGMAIVAQLSPTSYDTWMPFDVKSIYNQINSMRETNEFHEFCAERLFYELEKYYEYNNIKCRVDNIVALLYTRRGSLDINPVRYNKDITKAHYKKYIEPFINVRNLTEPSIIQ